MDATARRVQAERARRRLPRRLQRRRWAVRAVGLLATLGLLGVAGAIAMMVAAAGRDAGKDSSRHGFSPLKLATRTPTPRARHHGPTHAQLAQRRSAVAELSGQGYVPINLREYDFGSTLRVLIGRPTSDPSGPRAAFFFLHAHYLGRDSLSPSRRVSLVSSSGRTVTLAYRTYATTDASCCPSGPQVKVRFRWDGSRLQPLDAIPPASARQR